MTTRKRPRPKAFGEFPSGPKRPRVLQPPAEKPTYYRLIVNLRAGDFREVVILVARGPLGLCEGRGMQAANYGIFQLREDGTREWRRPRSVLIEPVEEKAHEEQPGG